MRMVLETVTPEMAATTKWDTRRALKDLPDHPDQLTLI